jgi:glyoxylase-like metal-dependent hydrolase (beta-lactamase superfamily II)
MRAALLKIGLAAAALMLASCSGGETAETPEAEAETAGIEIHRPFRPGAGSVNSYWLEGEDEVLVFDTQSTLANAEYVVERIRETGKPVTAIVISQYDPGHFGGLQIFTDAFSDAELLMSEPLADAIGRDLSGYVERLRETLGEDYRMPAEPTRMIENREELTVSGVPVIVHIVTDSEAPSITMLEIPSRRAILASDLVSNQMHPDFTDADIDSWPRVLDRLARDFSGYTLYPGHGAPGPVNLLAANQIAYISFVRRQMESEVLADDIATEAEISAAIAAIRSNYAGWEQSTDRPSQLRRNLEAIVAQLGGELETRRARAAEARTADD